MSGVVSSVRGRGVGQESWRPSEVVTGRVTAGAEVGRHSAVTRKTDGGVMKSSDTVVMINAY